MMLWVLMAYVFVLNLDYIPFHRISEESHLLSDWNVQLKNRYNACWSSTCRRNINDYWSSATSTLLLSMKSTWVCFISKRFHLDEVTVYDTAGWDFKDWSSISCKKVWICGYCMLSSPIYNGRFGLVSKTWNESIS